MSYTKGPWKAKFKTAQIVHAGLGYAIASVYGQYSGGYYSEPEVNANLKLIAAAPEMLELLKEVSRLIDRDATGGQDYDSFVYASGIQTTIDRLISQVEGE